MQHCKSFKLTFVSTVMALLAIGPLVVICGESADAAELLWKGDFETGDFSQYKEHFYDGGTVAVKRLVTSPVRGGRYATELTILNVEGDSSRSRAELITQMPDGGGRIEFKWDGPEYWIGFSFLFKEVTASTSTFFQIHAPNEPKGDPCDFAGNTFTVGGDGASLNGGLTKDVIIRVIENGGVSAGKGSGSNNRVVYRYPFPLNEWQDYVANFRLSTKGDGFYKVWKNGELVYSKSGLTNVNYRDSCGNLIPEDKRSHNGAHVGIYAGGTTGFRQIYYDEVQVARGPDGYKLVSGYHSDSPDVAINAKPNPPVVQN